MACECFGAYGTRFRVVHVVRFWGGPKLEAFVRLLYPSATLNRESHVRRLNPSASLNRESHWDTTDYFATSFFHFLLFSTALRDLSNSRPVHSLMSSHLCLVFFLFSLFHARWSWPDLMNTEVKVNVQKLQTVTSFKYLKLSYH